MQMRRTILGGRGIGDEASTPSFALKSTTIIIILSVLTLYSLQLLLVQPEDDGLPVRIKSNHGTEPQSQLNTRDDIIKSNHGTEPQYGSISGCYDKEDNSTVAAASSNYGGTNHDDNDIINNALSWKLLSTEEGTCIRQDSCNRPFQHCCLGQCRQHELSHLKKDAKFKFNGGRLANLSAAFDFYGNNIQHQDKSEPPHQQHQPTCNFFFVGDSLSSDHAMGATCDLLNYGYTMISCNLKGIGGPTYGRDAAHKCESNLHPELTHFMLQNNDKEDTTSSVCPNITISFLPLIPGSSTIGKQIQSAKSTHQDGGLIIFNWGVHCNMKNESNCISDALSSAILPHFNDDQQTKWKFLYRETEPQHFNSLGGLYPGEGVCTPLERSKADNWRNEVAQRFLVEHNLTKRVPTISIFQELVPLWQLHHSHDCTHYCYDPLRLDVTWNGLLKALDDLVLFSNE